MNKRRNILWIINAFLFAAVVFLGIEQASLGTTVSHLEGKVEKEIQQKQSVTDAIYNLSTSDTIEEKAQSLGFVKPADVIYLESDEVVAKLPSR